MELLKLPIGDANGHGLTVAPDGTVYFSTWGMDHRIRRLRPVYTPANGAAFAIASDDGTEVYEFDATGRHLRTRDALTGATLLTFAYGTSGRLTSVSDRVGNITTLQRVAGDLTGIVSPCGQLTSVTRDAKGYLATITDPAGQQWKPQHDTLGLLLRLTDAKNNPAQVFTYDSLGFLVRDDDRAGGFQTLARTETDSVVTVSLTSAMNRVRTFLRRLLPTGDIQKVETDATGVVTQRTILTTGTTVTNAPDGTIASVTEKADPRFGMQAPFTSAFSVAMPGGLTLDGSAKRTAALTNPLDPFSLTTLTDSVTVNGRTSTSVYAAGARTLTDRSPLGRQTVTTLDALGRVTEEKGTGLAAVKYTYGSRGFLITAAQGGRLTQYAYDSSGRVKQVTDPLGRVEQYAYDSVGRITKQTLPDGRFIQYAYDANGNLTGLTPPTKPVHGFVYRPNDQVDRYNPPAAGLPTFHTQYSYNADQQVTQVLRPDGLTLGIGYDAGGRANAFTLPTGSMAVTYNTGGNVATLGSPTGGSLAMTYDGSLPTAFTWTGTVAGAVGVAYDNTFRVTSLTVNGANPVSFGYDNDDLLTGAGALTLARDAGNGRLTGTTLGSATTSYTYGDSLGSLATMLAKYSTTTLFNATYTRDSLERITQLVETIQGTTKTWQYAYDSVGRLNTVRVNGTLVADYDYDGNGNRTLLTTTSGSVVGVYDDQDRMLTYGTATYKYTANGELTQRIVGTDTTKFTYDVLGNLLQVRLPNGGAVLDYLVDGQNRRIGKKVNGALVQGFLYQGQLAPIAELDGTGAVISRFVYATRPNVPEYMIKAGVTYRLFTDHLGSVRLVVNTSSGTVAQRIDYDEYGRVTQNTSPGFQPFGYAGGLLDTHSGLVRFGARDYDSESGRWASKDPIGFSGGSTNLLAYSLEDPVNYMDPSGLQVWVGWHSLSPLPGYHTFLYIIPSDGRAPFTIGGGPDGPYGIFGRMYVSRNRERDANRSLDVDVSKWRRIRPPPGCTEEEFIRLLEKLASQFRGVAYTLVPGTPWSSNSNSVTAGLLLASGAQLPSLPVMAPGIQYPLHPKWFYPPGK